MFQRPIRKASFNLRTFSRLIIKRFTDMSINMSASAYCIITSSSFPFHHSLDYLFRMHFLSSITLECFCPAIPKVQSRTVNINCAHYTSVTFYDKKRSCKHSLCCNRVNVIYFVFDCKKASIYLKVIYSSKESLAIYVVCIYYTKPLVYLL